MCKCVAPISPLTKYSFFTTIVLVKSDAHYLFKGFVGQIGLKMSCYLLECPYTPIK